jgi:hypothetical protein
MAEDKSLTPDAIRQYLDEAEQGRGPGIMVLIDSPGEKQKVFTMNMHLGTALAVAATAAELFTIMIKEVQDNVPEGTTYH